MGAYRKRKASPFILYPWDAVNSEAYKRLSKAASKVLPIFIGKDNHPKNRGEPFSFTYTEAYTRYGLARATFRRAINDLHAKGFIEIISYGGLRGAAKSDSKYKASDRWEKYGTDKYIKRQRYEEERVEL